MNKKLIYVGIFMAGIHLSSCQKEVPILKSKVEKRITGEWEITQYQVDGVGDLTETTLYTEITFEFDEDGDIEQYWTIDSDGQTTTYEFTGEWEVNKDDEIDLDFLTNSASNFFTGNYGGTREVYDILELDKCNFVFDGVFNGKTVEIRGTKKE